MPRRNAPRRRPQKKKRKKLPNATSFRPGPDDRRHLFTPEEARAGYQAAWEKMAAISADALAWFTRTVRNKYREEKKHGTTKKGR